MAEEDIPMEAESVSLEDSEDTTTKTDEGTNNMIPFIMGKYYKADDYRDQDETKMVESISKL